MSAQVCSYHGLATDNRAADSRYCSTRERKNDDRTDITKIPGIEVGHKDPREIRVPLFRVGQDGEALVYGVALF